MKRSLAIAAAVLLALCIAWTPASADAKPLQAARPAACSLPYVDDVNDWGPGRVVVTVTCAGQAKRYQVKAADTATGKRAKVTRHKRRAWSVVLKLGHVYRLSVRPQGGAWRSILYGVER